MKPHLIYEPLLAKILSMLCSYYKDIILVDDFLITTNRKTIESAKLIADKDVNFISIGIAAPLKAFGIKDGIRDPDGKIINPEVVLVDAEGVEYPLEHKGGRRGKGFEFANYGLEGDIPRGKRFEKVLLRCAVQIPTTRIQWSGYNIKDLP